MQKRWKRRSRMTPRNPSESGFKPDPEYFSTLPLKLAIHIKHVQFAYISFKVPTRQTFGKYIRNLIIRFYIKKDQLFRVNVLSNKMRSIFTYLVVSCIIRLFARFMVTLLSQNSLIGSSTLISISLSSYLQPE